MNFKEKYKESYDEVVPDQEFIKQLSEKMKEEKIVKPKSYYKPLAVVTCFALVFSVGLAAFHIIGLNARNSNPIENRGGEILPTPSTGNGMFASSEWYNQDAAPEEILSDFLKRLEDGKQLIGLYQNKENHFTDEMKISEEEMLQLGEQLKQARVTSDKVEKIENIRYYMSEFSNGDIVKFKIIDEKYMSFLDLEYRYKF